MQPTPQNNQLMSKHGVLSLKPQRRLEWRGQDGQSETEKPDHSANLGDSITSSTRIRFSVQTTVNNRSSIVQGLHRVVTVQKGCGGRCPCHPPPLHAPTAYARSSGTFRELYYWPGAGATHSMPRIARGSLISPTSLHRQPAAQDAVLLDQAIAASTLSVHR